ncbi:TraB/GumN family protein [Massilia sp. PAMC28688]|uniref:TraB/GumN family protein n=1 Tax=Massilia sp. PAMC28688 TaxID=2861283 RepID=UPI001C630E9C|nr:TraB/GumN family protein [Massilia sp. PAMC28688]QYF95584.1 TraB/GumN family protein [Massilia sp. PAMC28688]
MKCLTLGCTLALALTAASGQENVVPSASQSQGQDATAEVASGTVTVIGQRPGPGLWKVSKGDNVLWIFGVYSPLPTKMEWRSQQVEAAIAQSQEYLPQPGGGVSVGIFKGLTLLPHVFGLKKNPDGATLQQVLPPDVYGRWSVLKAKYIGENAGIERERPFFAAQTLLRTGLQRAGLSNGREVTKTISALVKKHQVKVTPVFIKIDAADPAQMMKDFKKSPMNDVACFTETLNRIEGDIGAMHARANAWARGTLSAIEKLSYADRELPCDKAMRENEAIKNMAAFKDLDERIRNLWMANAERALTQNKSTFAVLRMQTILDEKGYLAALEAKGYQVERPE